MQTIKYRNLIIDLENGVKTSAQLTYPAIGKGQFPGVLLIPGSGVADKNETLGFVPKYGPNPPAPLLQIAQYLSEEVLECLDMIKEVWRKSYYFGFKCMGKRYNQ